MFSDFKKFVFLGVFLAIVGVADAQFPSLEAIADTRGVYQIGDFVQVVFFVDTGTGPAGIELVIEHSGLGNVNVGNGSVITTNLQGVAVVTGMLLVEKGAYISATWVEAGLKYQVYINGIDVGVNGTTIVVSPPDPKFPLAIGDAFTQTIEIQDATDLAGWQMDIAFNPDVLEVVEIVAGDFLEQNGGNALFFFQQITRAKFQYDRCVPSPFRVFLGLGCW